MKIFRLILILALGLQIGFGADENGQNDNEQLKKEVFVNSNDRVVDGGSCTWQCRQVKQGYKTKIMNVDYETGTTICKIYEANNENNILPINANRTNEACRAGRNKAIVDEYANLVEKNTNKAAKNRGSSIKYDNNQKQLRLSQFMVGLITLNPNIINRKTTAMSGTIQLQDGVEIYSTTDIVQAGAENFNRKILSFDGIWDNLKNAGLMLYNSLAESEADKLPLSAITVNAIDGFNKNNMAYFSDLFGALETIYQHLQVFIFVLIGGFFVMQIGASKLQAYLENRGESEGKQPYLHKFYIPLLMIGIFFMPIPEGNGHQSTVMQNMIRYFAQYSTNIADMAHSVGAKTYMDKIYKKVGGLSPEVGVIMAKQEIQQKHQLEQINNIRKNNCDKIWQVSRHLNQSGGNPIQGQCLTTGTDYSNTTINVDCSFCQKLQIDEVKIRESLKRTEQRKKDLYNFDDDYAQKLNDIDKYFASRNNQLGWIDALLTPTASILVETFTISEYWFKSQQRADRNQMEESLKSMRAATQLGNSDGDMLSKTDEISDSWVGMFAGRLVWMMMPGGMAIKDFFLQIWEKISDIINDILFVLETIAFLSGQWIQSLTITILQFAINTGAVAGAYILASWLLEMTFDMIPLLAISTATLIAFVSYLVSLCKYFYISPFVTAWAMATKRVDKIIDFLLAGIAIFFKSILIVLFLYLTLFLNTLVQEFFVFVSIEQFGNIKTSFWNFHTNFIVGAISGLLKIFGILATSYISWKLIVSGPAWALGLIGLDGKQDDAIAQGIETNLAKRAFVA